MNIPYGSQIGAGSCAPQSAQERFDDIKRRALSAAEGLVHSAINSGPAGHTDPETLAHQVTVAAKVLEDYLTGANEAKATTDGQVNTAAHDLSRANSAALRGQYPSPNRPY